MFLHNFRYSQQLKNKHLEENQFTRIIVALQKNMNNNMVFIWPTRDIYKGIEKYNPNR